MLETFETIFKCALYFAGTFFLAYIVFGIIATSFNNLINRKQKRETLKNISTSIDELVEKILSDKNDEKEEK